RCEAHHRGAARDEADGPARGDRRRRAVVVLGRGVVRDRRGLRRRRRLPGAVKERPMDIVITFSGGKRVDAQAGAFIVATDQPVEDGGAGSAPAPFTLFLASLGTCAGLYVLGFCRSRNIPTDGIRLIQRSESDTNGRLLRITLEVHVPPTFPQRYRAAV